MKTLSIVLMAAVAVLVFIAYGVWILMRSGPDENNGYQDNGNTNKDPRIDGYKTADIETEIEINPS